MALPQLLYGFDPLCGWCYVFGASIEAVRERFVGQIDIDVICGGLVLGDRVKPMHEMRSYLQAAIPKAEARSGVRFGAAFTQELIFQDNVMLDSEPLCRAVFAARDVAPTAPQALDFALSLPRALYRDGQRIDLTETLKNLAHDAGMNSDEFFARWASARGMGETAKGFAFAKAIGISSYPVLLLRKNNTLTKVTAGYASIDDTVSAVGRALQLTDK